MSDRSRIPWQVLLDAHNASADERIAVEHAAHAMLLWERESREARERGEVGKFSATPYPYATGGQILDRVCRDPARWAGLATAAIYRAEELRGCPCGAGREVRRVRLRVQAAPPKPPKIERKRERVEHPNAVKVTPYRRGEQLVQAHARRRGHPPRRFADLATRVEQWVIAHPTGTHSECRRAMLAVYGDEFLTKTPFYRDYWLPAIRQQRAA